MKSSTMKFSTMALRVTSYFLLLTLSRTACSEVAQINTATLNGAVPIRTWKTMRDERVVKQDLDYSCGAASLATVMQEFYGLEVSEDDILQRMEDDGAASFQDLSDVAWEYEFNARGLALDFEQLKTLKIPVIAYLRHQGDDHFSVIRGIDSDGLVWLGDPSWGNRKFSTEQFKAMWQTRDDANLKGKILVVIPENEETILIDRGFFRPPEMNNVFMDIITIRNLVYE